MVVVRSPCLLPLGALSPLLVVLVTGCLAEPHAVPAGDDAGTSMDAGGAADASGNGRHHPEGWAAPAMHGAELARVAQDCRGCHGAQLTGLLGPSCDSCHAPGWRQDCTFCHGGDDNPTGAPPRDLGGITPPSFRAHTAHVSAQNHAPFDCTECHAKPTDPLTMGHVFDDTPGIAEVRFDQAGARSPRGTYDGAGTCSNLYCHGDGRNSTGVIRHDAPRPSCTGCHGPGVTLSGAHEKHLDEGAQCVDCHAATVDGSERIIAPALHVNTVIDVMLTAPGMTRAAATCTGTCHLGVKSEDHLSTSWFE